MNKLRLGGVMLLIALAMFSGCKSKGAKSPVSNKVEVKESKWSSPYGGDKLTLKTPYLNGKKHGKEKGYAENGKLRFEREWVHGTIEGIQTIYADDGSIRMQRESNKSKGIYVERKYSKRWDNNYLNETSFKSTDFLIKHGTLKSFTNGKLMIELPYRHGKKDGIEIRYKEDGSLDHKKEWDRGHLVRVIE